MLQQTSVVWSMMDDEQKINLPSQQSSAKINVQDIQYDIEGLKTVKSLLSIDLTADDELDCLEKSYLQDIIANLSNILDITSEYSSQEIKELRDEFCHLSYDFIQHRWKQLTEYAPLNPLNISYWTVGNEVDPQYYLIKEYRERENVNNAVLALKKALPSVSSRLIPIGEPEKESFPPIVRKTAGNNPYLHALCKATEIIAEIEPKHGAFFKHLKSKEQELKSCFYTLKTIQTYHQKIVPLFFLLEETKNLNIQTKDINLIKNKIKKIGNLIEKHIPYYEEHFLTSEVQQYKHIPWEKIIALSYFLKNSNLELDQNLCISLCEKFADVHLLISEIIDEELNLLIPCKNIKNKNKKEIIFESPFNVLQDYLGIRKLYSAIENLIPFFELSEWQPFHHTVLMRCLQIAGEVGKNLSKELYNLMPSFWNDMLTLRNAFSHPERSNVQYFIKKLFSTSLGSGLKDEFYSLREIVQGLYQQIEQNLNKKNFQDVMNFYNSVLFPNEPRFKNLNELRNFFESFLLSQEEREPFLKTLDGLETVSEEGKEKILTTLANKIKLKDIKKENLSNSEEIENILSQEEFLKLYNAKSKSETKVLLEAYKNPTLEKIEKVKKLLGNAEKHKNFIIEIKNKIHGIIDDLINGKFLTEIHFLESLEKINVNKESSILHAKEIWNKVQNRKNEYEDFKKNHNFSTVSYNFEYIETILNDLTKYLIDGDNILNFEKLSDMKILMACDFKIQMLEPALQAIKKTLPRLRDMEKFSQKTLILNTFISKIRSDIKNMTLNRNYLAHIHDVSKLYDREENTHKKRVVSILEKLLLSSGLQSNSNKMLSFRGRLEEYKKILIEAKIDQLFKGKSAQKEQSTSPLNNSNVFKYDVSFKNSSIILYEPMRIMDGNDLFATLGKTKDKIFNDIVENIHDSKVQKIIKGEIQNTFEEKAILLGLHGKKGSKSHNTALKMFREMLSKKYNENNRRKGPSLSIIEAWAHINKMNIVIWGKNHDNNLKCISCFNSKQSKETLHFRRISDDEFKRLYPTTDSQTSWESSLSATSDKTGRIFNIRLKDKNLALHECSILGDGDCAYRAMGMTRSDAVELLWNNVANPQIRTLIAAEIYKLFMELPKKMQNSNYEKFIEEEKRLDEEAQKLMNEIKKSLNSSEVDCLIREQLTEFLKNLPNKDSQQEEFLNRLNNLQNNFENLVKRKWDYCCEEETVKNFITYFMKPSPSEYFDTYDDTNWLHCASDKEDGKYNTSSMDALALLMNKNIVVLNEIGEIVHQKVFFETNRENTLFLLHIGNTHFNVLKIH
ncbi:MAG: hypothetical protein KBD63_04475 [Bacteriovoracaceae bacterium]|nr:hypothetical protein [Bacteriovoracaceae bacterium]